MIYWRQFTVLLSSIATFSQLDPTNAGDQTCRRAVADRDDRPAFKTLFFNSSCGGFNDMIECTLDLYSYSTNGDPNFASSCNSAGGEVYDVDIAINCPSNDPDNVTPRSPSTMINNVGQKCATPVP